MQLMDKLVTVLDIVHRGQVGEGVKDKHDKALGKVIALGAESVHRLVKSVREELGRNDMITGRRL